MGSGEESNSLYWAKIHTIINNAAAGQEYQINVKARRKDNVRLLTHGWEPRGQGFKDGTLPTQHGSIIKRNNEYWLYYMADIGTDNWEIRLATSSNIEGPYTFSTTVLEPTAGEWDSQWVGFPYVIDTGSTLYMYYEGYSTYSQIGFATSTNGTIWVKSPDNPVLSPGASGTWDDVDVGTPSLIQRGTLWYLFYQGHEGGGVTKIGFATSPSLDGPWEKYSGNPVLSNSPSGWDSFWVGARDIIEYKGQYAMFFEGNDKSGVTGVQTGVAFSDDLTDWQKFEDNPIFINQGTWDYQHYGIRGVFQEGSTIHLFYTGFPYYGDGIFKTELPDYWDRVLTLGTKESFDDLHFRASDETPLTYGIKLRGGTFKDLRSIGADREGNSYLVYNNAVYYMWWEYPSTGQGQIEKYDLVSGSVSVLWTAISGRATAWKGWYDEENAILWLAGQYYDGTYLRSAIWQIDLTTDSVSVTTHPNTGDINEFIAIHGDSTYLYVGERGVGGSTGGSSWPNGGGVWRIPKATWTDTTTWERQLDGGTNSLEVANIFEFNNQLFLFKRNYSFTAPVVEIYLYDPSVPSQTLKDSYTGANVSTTSGIIIRDKVYYAIGSGNNIWIRYSTNSDLSSWSMFDTQIQNNSESGMYVDLVEVGDLVLLFFNWGTRGAGGDLNSWVIITDINFKNRFSLFKKDYGITHPNFYSKDSDNYYLLGALVTYLVQFDISTIYADSWIKVPLSTGLTTEFLVCYNSSWTSKSNLDQTLYLFDDALTDKTSAYTLRDIYSTGLNASLTYEPNNHRNRVNFTAHDGVFLEGTTLPLEDCLVEMEGLITSDQNQQIGVIVRFSSTECYWLRKIAAANVGVKVTRIVREPTPPNTSLEIIATQDETNYLATNTWYKVVGKVFGTDYTVWSSHERRILTGSSSDVTGTAGVFIGNWDYTVQPNMYFKNVLIRKYAQPEPAHSTWSLPFAKMEVQETLEVQGTFLEPFLFLWSLLKEGIVFIPTLSKMPKKKIEDIISFSSLKWFTSQIKRTEISQFKDKLLRSLLILILERISLSPIIFKYFFPTIISERISFQDISLVNPIPILTRLAIRILLKKVKVRLKGNS